MQNSPMSLKILRIGLCAGALAGMLIAVAGCNSDDKSQTSTTQTRNSLYDPMKDAAPGDELPSVPSVSDISPDQQMGTGSAGVIIPGGGNSAASLGALNGGRR